MPQSGVRSRALPRYSAPLSPGRMPTLRRTQYIPYPVYPAPVWWHFPWPYYHLGAFPPNVDPDWYDRHCRSDYGATFRADEYDGD